MKKPQISVLLCVYNPKIEQLRKSVNSVLNQTFTDWEMFIYDDGSDSDIAKQIETISTSDKRIIHIRNNEHHSLAFGLNCLIGKTNGRYLARMDADDISVSSRFEKQLVFLDEHKEFEYVGSSIELIDCQDVVYEVRFFPEIPDKKDFLNYSPYAHPALMFRKECLIRNHGYIQDENALRGEDYELLMRLHSEGDVGYNIKEPLLKYREDVNKNNKHSFSIQVNELKIRWNGFRRLKILGFYSLPYVLKPLVVWVAPDFFIRRVRNRTTDRIV